MIRIDPTDLNEPEDFNARCRIPGNLWLEARPEARRPRDFWSPFKAHLAVGFKHLCAYSALHIPALTGSVDHFIPFDSDNGRSNAYEWANFRYCQHWVNSSKRNLGQDQLLDPLNVQEGWFRLDYPSLQLIPTDAIPGEFRERAHFTIERLRLVHDERVIRQRRAWLQEYEAGHVSLDLLARYAPLVADLVRRENLQPN